MTSTPLTLSFAAAEVRRRWYAESASAGWVFASDWHDPAVDALCEACLRQENIWAPAERLGVARAASGASLGETLADVDALTAVLPEVPTDLLYRAVSLGWADRMSTPTASVFDPLTGLVSKDYLATRLGEVYRAAEVAGYQVSTRHALVVVRVDLSGRRGWDRLAPLILAADALRTVFDAGQSLARLSDQMAVALTDRDDMLARRTQLCAGLVTERLVQDRPAGRIEHHRCTPLPRVWIEQLPDSQAAAVALISELGR
jgi:hypothetical protein